MPEAPYETDDIAFSDEDGNEIDGILGKREGNRVNGMVNGISSDEEAMFAGTGDRDEGRWIWCFRTRKDVRWKRFSVVLAGQ